MPTNFAQQNAWKTAHAMMWQRWQDFIDFEALKKRHLELPVEWRYDALFQAIGMLYGEYLTEHINEYNELEAQLLERFKLEEKSPDKPLTDERCPRCGGPSLKNGRLTESGIPEYYCQGCRRTFWREPNGSISACWTIGSK